MIGWLEWGQVWFEARHPSTAATEWEALTDEWLRGLEQTGLDPSPGGFGSDEFLRLDRWLSPPTAWPGRLESFYDRLERAMADRLSIDEMPPLTDLNAFWRWVDEIGENFSVASLPDSGDARLFRVEVEVLSSVSPDLMGAVNAVYEAWLISSDGYNARRGTRLPVWYEAEAAS